VSLEHHARDHRVQFYGSDDQRLAREVAQYLADSLNAGGTGLVIASTRRREAIRHEIDRLGGDAARDDQRLRFLDDADTLAAIVRDGHPKPELFEANVGMLAADLSSGGRPLHAYGEMVGRLWSERSFAAAIELERLWNELMCRVNFGLFCGYPIDVMSEDFQASAIRPLLAEHSRLVSAVSDHFARAMHRAMTELLGDAAHGLQTPGAAEETILRLRSALPRYADAILSRASTYA
jgi:hypothetical protein